MTKRLKGQVRYDLSLKTFILANETKKPTQKIGQCAIRYGSVLACTMSETKCCLKFTL